MFYLLYWYQGKKRDKLVLVSWCPDSTKVRTKFIHAASVEGLKRAIPGATFVQVFLSLDGSFLRKMFNFFGELVKKVDVAKYQS